MRSTGCPETSVRNYNYSLQFLTDVSGQPVGRIFKGQDLFIDPWRWGRQVVPKRRQEITTTRRVTTQKLQNISHCCQQYERTKVFM